MTVAAQDAFAVGEEAGAHQRHGALRAGEARLVPLALLERDVFASAETWTKRDTHRRGHQCATNHGVTMTSDHVSSR